MMIVAGGLGALALFIAMMAQWERLRGSSMMAWVFLIVAFLVMQGALYVAFVSGQGAQVGGCPSDTMEG